MTTEIKRTIKEIQEIDQIVAGLYGKDAKLQQGKFGYAYKRFVEKNYQPAITRLQEKLADVRVDFALTDPTSKELLLDKENARGYKYDKDGMKKVMEAERKLAKDWETEEITITPFISKEVPKELSDEQKEILKGIII